MKIVLELLGSFLYLGYRIIMLPIGSVLYALLGLVLFLNYTNAIWKMLPALVQKAVAFYPVYKHKFRLNPKWQVGLFHKLHA